MDVQWLSLAELVSELRTEMRDPLTGSSKWSDAEIELEIRQGVRLITPMVYVKDIYTLSIAAGTWRYDLPDYVHRIIPPVKARYSASTGDFVDLSYYEHERTLEYNYFYIKRAHGSWNLDLLHERHPPNVPGNMTTGATLDATATSVTLDAASSAVATRLEPYGYVKIEDEIIKHTGVYNPATFALTVLTRGQRGTTAVAHNTIGTVVSPIVEVPDGRVYNWLLDYSSGKLHRIRLTGQASADLAGDVTSMREYDAAAERSLRRILPSRKRQLILERPRRLRRLVI